MAMKNMPESDLPAFRRLFLDHLEAMISDNWVDAWTEEGFTAVPKLDFDTTVFMHENRDVSRSLVEA